MESYSRDVFVLGPDELEYLDLELGQVPLEAPVLGDLVLELLLHLDLALLQCPQPAFQQLRVVGQPAIVARELLWPAQHDGGEKGERRKYLLGDLVGLGLLLAVLLELHLVLEDLDQLGERLEGLALQLDLEGRATVDVEALGVLPHHLRHLFVQLDELLDHLGHVRRARYLVVLEYRIAEC